MADALFDTTVFIDYEQGEQGALELCRSVFDRHLVAAYSAITAFELSAGAPRRRSELLLYTVVRACEEIPLTAPMAQLAAALLRGRSIRREEALFRDALIAATAIHSGLTVYTRNTADFQQLGADVQTY